MKTFERNAQRFETVCFPIFTKKMKGSYFRRGTYLRIYCFKFVKLCETSSNFTSVSLASTCFFFHVAAKHNHTKGEKKKKKNTGTETNSLQLVTVFAFGLETSTICSY